MSSRFSFHTPFILTVAVFASVQVASASTAVKTAAALRQAVAQAKPGDTITVANGSYADFGSMVLRVNGSSEKPITLRAETPGGVTFTGDAQLQLEGSHATVSGFRFIQGKPATTRGAIVLKGSDLRATECTITGFNVGNDATKTTNWVNLDGDHLRVDHCSFQGKVGMGVLLVVVRNDTKPNYHQIDHNVFRDFAFGNDANGFETIRVGTSPHSQSDSFTTITENYFEACDGEAEIISVKSGHNTISGNTIVNCRGILTLRQGRNNTVTGNVILNPSGKVGCGGIRICDGPHLIADNYIDGVRTKSLVFGGIVLSSSESDAPTDPAQHWPVHDVVLRHNSVINSEESIVSGAGTYGHAPVSAHYEGNLICSQVPSRGPVVLFHENLPTTQVTVTGDVYFHPAGVAAPLPVGTVQRDPQLVAKTINGYTLYFPRTEKIGAPSDQLHPLRASDVGPSAYAPR